MGNKLHFRITNGTVNVELADGSGSSLIIQTSPIAKPEPLHSGKSLQVAAGIIKISKSGDSQPQKKDPDQDSDPDPDPDQDSDQDQDQDSDQDRDLEQAHTQDSVTLAVDTSKVIGITADEYVSFNIDSSANRDFFNRDLSNPVYSKYAKALAPSFLRVGGTGADSLFYSIGSDANITVPPDAYHYNKTTKGKSKEMFFPPTYLNASLWDSVNRLATASGSRLIFNMNYFQFMLDKGSNLETLLRYSIARNYSIFGIEPTNEIMTPSPKMLHELFKVLVELYPDAASRPHIIGPDSSGTKSLQDMQKSAKEAGVPLYASTYHCYSHDMSPTDILKASSYDKEKNSSVYWEMDETHTQVWIGEAGSHGGGGIQNMSDTFANGFWYLETLGSLATYNHKVVLRQDLVGAWYGFLRDEFWYPGLPVVTPNVDYFNALLFKRLMGNAVLETKLGHANEIKAYAHCSRNAKVSGSVSILILNFQRNSSQVVVKGLGQERVDYLLTGADGTPFASQVKLNKKLLVDAGDIVGAVSHEASVVKMPALSYGFFVFEKANAKACKRK